MPNNCIYRISHDLITKTVDEKLLVTSLSEGNDHVFEIEGSGLDIWRALEKGVTMEALIEELKEEWEDFGDPEHQELDQYLKDLIENKLIIMDQK